MRSLLVILCLVISIDVYSCVVAPDSMWDSNQELVNSTPHIALARVTDFQPGKTGWVHGKFEFEVIENLKGNPPTTFSLDGYQYGKIEVAPGDFKEHKDPAFWAYDAGNSILPGDCSAYGIFYKGGQYLIFFRDESHPRAFEEIASAKDLWLSVVNLLIQDEATSDAISD